MHTQAYMSALTSSVKVLEDQVATINSTSGSLSVAVSRAFGDNAVQRDSQADVQITQLYQVCVVLMMAVHAQVQGS
jgi:hypothetical protein